MKVRVSVRSRNSRALEAGSPPIRNLDDGKLGPAAGEGLSMFVESFGHDGVDIPLVHEDGLEALFLGCADEGEPFHVGRVGCVGIFTDPSLGLAISMDWRVSLVENIFFISGIETIAPNLGSAVPRHMSNGDQIVVGCSVGEDFHDGNFGRVPSKREFVGAVAVEVGEGDGLEEGTIARMFAGSIILVSALDEMINARARIGGMNGKLVHKA